ncbi:YchJ family protein [Nocardioides bruguierae]|uniref:YchJ family protein n=1 Tax=Nocardioides bruguierae TaxID=2945102 RepID=UPI0020200237|nr:YchJ family metal-binding protein [Nocardioides bruguierae]MCL8027210.1 YchJ family metal-binding protein [Nocardioides bruguierae]
MISGGGPCPCGTGRTYDDCCGPLHRGAARATGPEQLMRSRYTAFALGHADHLFRTWHPRTRPRDPAALEPDPATTWTGLEVHGAGTTGEGADAEGWVEFTARYSAASGPGSLHERSRFVVRAGHWVYLDGVHD